LINPNQASKGLIINKEHPCVGLNFDQSTKDRPKTSICKEIEIAAYEH
jgi:hypothetical protein